MWNTYIYFCFGIGIGIDPALILTKKLGVNFFFDFKNLIRDIYNLLKTSVNRINIIIL